MPLVCVKEACQKMDPERCNIFETKDFADLDYRHVHSYATGLALQDELITRVGNPLSSP